MKMRKLIGSIGAALAVLIFIPAAHADITIDTVTVGNPGNAADTVQQPISGTYLGSVGYTYNIGKYDVTNSQYAAFLNSVAQADTYSLYNGNMASYGITQGGLSGSYSYSVTSGLENRPVVYVSWFDAARFCNWLSNGQKSGAQDATTTEAGAYALNGAMSGVSVSKNLLAQWYIPSENEWYKAAYYDPTKNGGLGGYWAYPTRSDSISPADANYNLHHSTDVGAYAADASAYGTFDQGGNVWQWNDEDFYGSDRGLRGGSWDYGSRFLLSSHQDSSDPTYEDSDVGFRVATVPEPSTYLLIGLSGILCATLRRKPFKL